jgi:hypothetical protein
MRCRSSRSAPTAAMSTSLGVDPFAMSLATGLPRPTMTSSSMTSAKVERPDRLSDRKNSPYATKSLFGPAFSEICCSKARYACAHGCRSGSCRYRIDDASSMSAVASRSPREESSSLSLSWKPMPFATIDARWTSHVSSWMPTPHSMMVSAYCAFDVAPNMRGGSPRASPWIPAVCVS